MRFCEFCHPEASAEQADVHIFGIPLEGKVNSRSGAFLAPHFIRIASDCIESYSPQLGRCLEEVRFSDCGDLALPGRSLAHLNDLEPLVLSRLPPGRKGVFLGGDHTISLPVVKAFLQRYPELHLLHLDAHPDTQDSFLGEKVCYATVIRRIAEILPPERIFQLGMRTGTREEFEWSKDHTQFFPAPRSSLLKSLKVVKRKVKGNPLYLSFDIDFFDPIQAPGTGNPEAGGILYPEVLRLLKEMGGMNLIGFDCVEVAPLLDPSARTAILAAQLIRDCILAFWGKGR